MQTTKTYMGKLYFVSGISGGREAFLGKAIDEPYEGYLSLEGKTVSITPQGVMTIRPFATLINFPIRDPICTIQQIHLAEVRDEAKAVLESSIAQISAVTRPLLFSWMETCLVRDNVIPTTWVTDIAMHNRLGIINPIFGFYEGFVFSAEQFRRALFETPQVNGTAELDKMTELEGDLTIEIGKITNQIAIKLNKLLTREKELTRYLAAVQSAEAALAAPASTIMGGWTLLIHRIQLAKNWARGIGNTALVREINLLTKEGINNLNETILEHCGSLDMLIAEAFAQYGITSEIYGDMSPFSGYLTPVEPTRTYGRIETTVATTPTPPIVVGRP